MEVKTTKILSITKGEVKKVYDIQVKKNHNFFANNLLVHNCIFQEQIALLAHKLGKDVSLDDGNKLRKLLTKKGTGKGFEEKDKIHSKFIDGCREKGISQKQAQQLWETFEYFSGYGFNKCLSFSEMITVYNSDGSKIEDKQIKDIEPGCFVRSRDEKSGKDIFVRVKENHHNGKKKVIKFTFDDGREVKCTMDHKFRTKCGRMLPISQIMKKGLEIVMAKIIAFEEVGEQETYDLEVEHEDHQFYLSNGVLTSNSHAVCYSILSYQCAWLATYYESEWLCAFLEKESEQDSSKEDKINRKEKAINIVKSLGYIISSLDLNKSGRVWEITTDGKEFVPPLTSIKGLGEAAMNQILNNRPFNNVEDFLFNENVSYSKLNKKALDVLIRAGACVSLIDSRFTGAKHFWSAVAVDRPKNKKIFHQNIETYKPEGDFSMEEKIQYLTDLTGEYPVSMVLPPEISKRLEEKYVPPIGEYDEEIGLTWFVVRNCVRKTSSSGKDYLVLEVIDDTNTMVQIRCWGVKPNENVHKNRVYMAKLDYDPSWGFSMRNIASQLKMIA